MFQSVTSESPPRALFRKESADFSREKISSRPHIEQCDRSEFAPQLADSAIAQFGRSSNVPVVERIDEISEMHRDLRS
jgi:hypothetical protein